MHATDTIEINATPDQTWQVLTDLHRLPEWYVPAQSIEVQTEGAVRKGWQFILKVKTLPGIVLDALGTVKEFDPTNHAITWSGQATGISGDSRWQLRLNADGTTRIDHTFEGQGWLMFLSDKSGRNAMTVRKRLTNLKALVERDAPRVA
ncbi:SRPBCC family protein [Anaerolineales bacterium HSG25]|nr:SRPBCC family protein [Anaerolineales bacterium HSG25]